MRTLFAATLIILAAILIAAASSIQAASMLGYNAGCVFRKTLGRYNGNYNNTAIAFNEPRMSGNSVSFLVQSDGSFDVNMFGSQTGLIGLVPGNPPITSVNGNFCTQSGIKYTPNQIDASTIKVGQTYCIANNANDQGTNVFVVNVVAIGSNTTTVDVFALTINTPSDRNQYCWFVQTMDYGKKVERCATNEYTKISTPCN